MHDSSQAAVLGSGTTARLISASEGSEPSKPSAPQPALYLDRRPSVRKRSASPFFQWGNSSALCDAPLRDSRCPSRSAKIRELLHR
jgi:hypothetical protein